MVKRGIFRVFTFAAVLAAAACDRPTAPELVARIDAAERDLLSDTTAERKLEGRFAGSWNLVGLLPNGRVDPNLSADIDGVEHRFKAFVFERVVVRLDPNDGYPCPLAQRSLLAIEGGRQSFLLRGSDFNQPVGKGTHDCGRTLWLNQADARPFLEMDRIGDHPRIFGISGSARIVDEGTTGLCSFLKVDRSFPLKVDCELLDYRVELAVQLGVASSGLTPGRASPQRMLSAVSQRVPGFRLVIYCHEKGMAIGGCEPLPRQPRY